MAGSRGFIEADKAEVVLVVQLVAEVLHPSLEQLLCHLQSFNSSIHRNLRVIDVLPHFCHSHRLAIHRYLRLDDLVGASFRLFFLLLHLALEPLDRRVKRQSEINQRLLIVLLGRIEFPELIQPRLDLVEDALRHLGLHLSERT